ncbi:C-3',4' desaturase CrtD [Synechococcus sp. HK01-R]|jgi:C-3',4' desaturase CrtD|uniref:C-3',4' desaturase CrtD n=1 Tax=Synechococcus sp. HK01-R TaxID=2751171 RepID=UPI0016286BD3|nr:C-3',4' desaturase CrtD [Synechococcus sp. HK01-R]QNG27241.1 C-3',4' desaturase CrtD [Synechococcus sp. HK01-R]
MEEQQDVIVIGGGIAGLTAAALLARHGLQVTLLEAHYQLGGCAGTFRRGPYTFDVGATQVAGLEPGGSHARIFKHLNLEPPEAVPLDPGCVVDLADGTEPIRLWRDPERWKAERQRQFPGSDRFWSLCSQLHQSNWAFAGRDPVLPIRSGWDLLQTIGALGPATMASAPLSLLTVGDLLRISSCSEDQRLRRFLDLQLRLYSQEPVERTAALYGATVLQMAQNPQGLWHLHGSMQVLSDRLASAFKRDRGCLRLRQRVTRLTRQGEGSGWRVQTECRDGSPSSFSAADVVCSLPPQCLPTLIREDEGAKAMPLGYRRQLMQLDAPSGALVLYGAVRRDALPADCPGHLQRDGESPGSLFVSVSQEGDGRAPIGEATLIASVFTDPGIWCQRPEADYKAHKRGCQEAISHTLEQWLGFSPDAWRHQELATPRSFAHWTGRPNGIVGGLGQSPRRFGPFGLASRTPLANLWLCGDSIHPGEGTAGVTLSALMACRQLTAQRGRPLKLKDS